jgi:ABC-type uncharacterized transport system substrate-binding protein
MGQGHSRRGYQGSVIPRGSVPVVGLLLAGDRTYPSVAAFSEEMEELGYKDGETVRLEARFSDGRLDELPRLAEDLVRCGVDVIAVIGAVTYWAARKAAPDLPILFAIVLDPVAAGIVDNAQRPGGLETGCTNFDPGQTGEQIRLLKTVVPGLRRLAVLGDAGVPDILPSLARVEAEKVGLDADVVLLKGRDDLAPAFAEITANGAEALVCLEVPRIATNGAEIVRLAAAARLPAISGRDHARYGPLMAYGTSLAAAVRRMTFQVDEVLSGTEVGEIPIQVITQPELIINLNAARELEISLPSDLLRSAHKVLG